MHDLPIYRPVYDEDERIIALNNELSEVYGKEFSARYRNCRNEYTRHPSSTGCAISYEMVLYEEGVSKILWKGDDIDSLELIVEGFMIAFYNT